MIGPLTDLYYYYAMMKLAKVDSITHRGASRGSVWLSPFALQVLGIKADKIYNAVTAGL